MPDLQPPTIDPTAAARWQRRAPLTSPWLHEEVARRMEERLQWIVRAPEAWVDWEPVRGGLEGHARVAQRYPKALCHVVELPHRQAKARERLAAPWWRRWAGSTPVVDQPPEGASQMVWANMALHTAAEPQSLLRQWHRALAVDGFLMFSCLGPDSLRQLRALYLEMGWPAPGHEFTDMHDWGDMLVHGGFAEPVMDMERITLTWDSPQRLLAELRTLGGNLHPARFAGLRGRGWGARLEALIGERLAGADGRLALTFEIIYGHAFKPEPRLQMAAEAGISLRDMRAMLRDTGRPRSD